MYRNLLIERREWLFPSRLGLPGLVLLLGHTAHLLIMHLTSALRLNLALETLVGVALSYLSVYTLYALLTLLPPRPRPLRVAALTLLPPLHAFAACYLYATKNSIDVGVIADNAAEASSLEALAVTLSPWTSRLSLTLLGVHLLVAAALLLLEKQRRAISSIQQPTPHLPKLASTLALLTFLLPIGPYLPDEVLAFTASTLRYALAEDPFDGWPPPGEFPLAQPAPPDANDHALRTPAEPLPHVFLLMVESFNARVVEAQTPGGQPITPAFNDLIHQGLYVEHFYGNSIQTSKGHLAILFSQPPLARGKTFRHHPNVHLPSLASVLRDAGYDTRFYQAHASLAFDNTGPFLASHGFDDVRSIHDRITPQDAPRVWGWGPQDDLFYERLFEDLDQRHAIEPDARLFVALATVSNHMRFNVPAQKRAIYPEPQNLRQRYANSIHLSDQALPVFLKLLRDRPWLDNSLIIITGDHSFPIGEHGIEHNEIGFYDDSFRVPLLVLWPGKLAPQRIQHRAHSQLDIAPTVLDLLHLTPDRHPFQGRSILSQAPPPPALLVQPYNGTYLGAVRFPWKYLKRLKTGEELLFHLQDDPGEDHNLIDDAPPSLLQTLRNDLLTIQRDNHLLTIDRVWDEDLPTPHTPPHPAPLRVHLDP